MTAGQGCLFGSQGFRYPADVIRFTMTSPLIKKSPGLIPEDSPSKQDVLFSHIKLPVRLLYVKVLNFILYAVNVRLNCPHTSITARMLQVVF